MGGHLEVTYTPPRGSQRCSGNKEQTLGVRVLDGMDRFWELQIANACKISLVLRAGVMTNKAHIALS